MVISQLMFRNSPPVANGYSSGPFGSLSASSQSANRSAQPVRTSGALV